MKRRCKLSHVLYFYAMESIRKIYKIGHGPSSSHTMGPRKAAEMFLDRNKGAKSFKVTLYGSLALTGKGHMTDLAIQSVLGENTPIDWKRKEELPLHPNGMCFEAMDESGKIIDHWEVYSVGGGEIMDKDHRLEPKKVYPHSTMADIMDFLVEEGGTFWEYVKRFDEADTFDYLKEVWENMKAAVLRGLETDGTLPGGLKLQRKAPAYHVKARMQQNFASDESYLFAYALAVSEENASGHVVVTAPTCGSSGILPAILYHFYKNHHFLENRIINALATAGLIGNLVKENASISGAEVGCQGEVGTASAMAAAAATQLAGGTIYQIENAASSALEHHLGLTCDPVAGLVQIPCIERNAFGAQGAMGASLYAINSDGQHFVMFDQVVEAMKRTGHDLPSLYKETSKGGLAAVYFDKKRIRRP
jgi:L-serine dehydratase